MRQNVDGHAARLAEHEASNAPLLVAKGVSHSKTPYSALPGAAVRRCAAAHSVLNALLELNRERGVTVLLVEQNAHLALDFATYGYVLERGQVVRAGPTEELRRSGEIAEIYLGVSAAADVGDPQTAT